MYTLSQISSLCIATRAHESAVSVARAVAQARVDAGEWNAARGEHHVHEAKLKHESMQASLVRAWLAYEAAKQ